MGAKAHTLSLTEAGSDLGPGPHPELLPTRYDLFPAHVTVCFSGGEGANTRASFAEITSPSELTPAETRHNLRIFLRPELPAATTGRRPAP